VESDEPQVTVNERFEVFFPEKRPFFIENASYFQTPINLLFTRRIADPQFGARLSGKIGGWALGALVADDESPGKSVPPGDPLAGHRALFGIVRVNRDFLQQSTIGLIFADRELDCGSGCAASHSYNRVGGVDARFRLNQNWVATAQAVTSATKDLDGSYLAGPAYNFGINRRGRSFNTNFSYIDRSPGFATLAGFVPRTDIREYTGRAEYSFRPKNSRVLSWGPRVFATRVYDHSGNRLNWEVVPQLEFEFASYTRFAIVYGAENELLRPQDAPGVAANMDFHRVNRGFIFSTSWLRQVTVSGEYIWGQRINIDPPPGEAPALVDRRSGNLTVTLRPTRSLRSDNTYLFLRLLSRADGSSVFNNHIIRSKWNYQFTRELSLRVILQYDALLPNQANTSLEKTKNFNADILFTWLLHPGTAIYAGYNSNLENMDIVPCTPPATCSTQVVRTNRFINNAKGFFVKASYLFRF
jgi:hypothetical protein